MPVSSHGIPMRPNRVTRDEARSEKARARAFTAALAREARAAHWRIARGNLFRQQGDWFIDILPDLGWGSGAIVRHRTKPMAVDPIFWDIHGLPGHDRLPLSFRAFGALALHPPWSEIGIAHDVASPELLAERVVAWSDDMLAKGKFPVSIDAMLEALAGPFRNGGFRALVICLLILNGNRAEALEACGPSPGEEADALLDGGGFATFDSERGTMTAFTEQARAWLLAHET